MKTPGMTDERIFELIEAYGADPEGFPEAERAGAMQRMSAAPALFAAALDEARRLDGALARLPDVTVSSALRAALLADAPKPEKAASRSASGLRRFLPAWIPAGALASLAMGILIGVNVSVPSAVATASADDEADAVMYAALGFGEYALMDETTE